MLFRSPLALQRVGELLAGGVQRGKLTDADRAAVQERLATDPALASAVRDADVVIEATGTAEGWQDAVRAVRRGGTVVLFSGIPNDVDLDANRLHYDELTLKGAFHHTPKTVRRALTFLTSGARPWEKLLTHQVSLEQLPGLFADPPPGYLKAIVRP